MQFRRLGKTGFRVSEISLGTVEIGIDYGIGANGTAERPGETESADLLHRALDLGINFIDTARAYGEAEAIIGRTLAGRRDEFFLCSKVAVPPSAAENPHVLRESISTSVEASLRALKTDVIDMMMIHSAPLEVIREGTTARILEELRDAGKFRWIGASVYEEGAALEAIRCGTYDCLQIAYSALDRRPESRVFPEAEDNDIGIVARSVVLKGVLTPRYRYLPDFLDVLKQAALQLDQIAESVKMSLPELAYRYALSHPIPHTALVGARSIGELEAAVHSAEAGSLAPELTEQIRSVTIENQSQLNPSHWPIG